MSSENEMFSIYIRSMEGKTLHLSVTSNTLINCYGRSCSHCIEEDDDDEDSLTSKYSFEEFLVNEIKEAHKLDHDFASKAVDEYVRFLELKITETDYAGKHFSPSLIIDEIWHIHILNTARYKKDCKEIHAEVANNRAFQFIHHSTERARDPPEVIQNRRDHFLVNYQQKYNTPPPDDIWKNVTLEKPLVFCGNCVACKVNAHYKTHKAQNEQRIIYSGKQLYGSYTLKYYNIERESILDVVLRWRGC